MLTFRSFAVSCAACIFIFAAQGAPAQEDQAEAEVSAHEAVAPTAPVMRDGEALFSVRGVSALPAAERAARITAAIKRVANDATFDPAALSVVKSDPFTSIMAGDVRILALVDADARLEDVGRDELRW